MTKSQLSANAADRRRREKRNADGLCTSCGGERGDERFKMCKACRMKQNGWRDPEKAKVRKHEITMGAKAYMEEHGGVL